MHGTYNRRKWTAVTEVPAIDRRTCCGIRECDRLIPAESCSTWCNETTGPADTVTTIVVSSVQCGVMMESRTLYVPGVV